MKRMFSFHFLTVATLLVVFPLVSHASFYLEPYLGYENGNYDYPGGKSDFTGTHFGGKAGISYINFAFGLDYMTGNVKEKGNNFSVKGDTIDWGLFAQFRLPLVKFSATYFVNSKYDVNNSPSNVKGSGYKIGAGYTGFPIISLNLDLIRINYDSGFGPGPHDDDRHTFLFSISAPLNF